MTPPIDPEALQKVLKTLPPEAPDPFAHLAFLTPEGLLQRRIELTHTIKTAEAERTAIDQELTGAYGDAELRRGVRAPGGWILSHAPEPVGTMPLKSVMRSRVFRGRHNGMVGHNR